MVLRKQAFGNRMVSAVAGTTVVLGMHHWSRSFGEQRSLSVVRELRRPRGYECGTVDYLQLQNVVGIL